MNSERHGDGGPSSRTRVLRSLHTGGSTTRAALGVELGLGRSTVKTLVDGIVEAGLACERTSGAGAGVGRPSLLVSLRVDAAVVAAVDVRADRLSTALVGLGGGVLARDDRIPERRSTEAVVFEVADAVRKLARAVNVDPAQVGVAVPGPVRATDGLVREAVDLGWTEIDVGAALAAELGLGVSVGNDAELGVLAEHVRGVARGVDDVVFLLADGCVGAGVMSGGVPVRGSAGPVGELGHMVVQVPGRTCRCGCDGCWETVVGTSALRAALGLGSDDPPERMAQALAAPDVADLLGDYAEWLAVGLTNVVNMLGPEMIVLGDPFDGLPAEMITTIGAVVGTRSLLGRSGDSTPRVVRARLGRDACLVGAAELAFGSVLPTL